MKLSSSVAICPTCVIDSLGDAWKISGVSQDSLKTAVQAPMFCTSRDRCFVLLTAAVPKSTSSGKLSAARRPNARTGTMNFSRSVQHTRSTLYSRTSWGRNLTTKQTSMPVATLLCLSVTSLPRACGPLTSK